MQPRAPATPMQTCQRCGQRWRVPLGLGELCGNCQSTLAWEAAEQGQKLVIRLPDIKAAEARALHAAQPEGWLRRSVRWIPVALALSLTAAAVGTLIEFSRPQALASPAHVFAALRRTLWWAALLSISGLAIAAVGLYRIRRSRHLRSLWLLSAHLLPLSTSAVLLGVTLICRLTLGSPSGWAHLASVPPVPQHVSMELRRVMEATVVILAPDEEGDARNLSIGIGTVVATHGSRALILTCSHVAIPYISPSAPRNPATARPVWVMLTSGYSGLATVRWAAPPPIDLALLEVQAPTLPTPVTVALTAAGMVPGSAVSFVPNPLRSGWGRHRGEVVARKPRRLPNGRTFNLLHTSVPVQPGDSGSGLYDAQWRLVGINTWIDRKSGYIEAISLPADTLGQIVKRLQHQNQLRHSPQPSKGVP